MLPSPSATSGGQGILPTPGSTAGTKRPATSDLHRAAGATSTPTKRHATKGSVGSSAGAGLAGASIMQTPTTGPPAPPPPPLHQQQHHPPPPPQYPHQHVLAPGPAHAPAPPMPALITEDQLAGRTPEQLMATILQIQNQHQQYFASVSAQYESITHQLNELRSSLAAFYNGQSAAHQAAIAHLQSSPPNPFGGDHTRLPRAPAAPAPQAIAPQAPQSSPPRPPASMANRPTRPPPQSPLQQHSDARLLPKQSSAQPPQTPGPPAYDYRTVGTVEEVWKEYREGMDGQPAIEELDLTWGSRWRPEPRGRTWYSRRKVIWDKIKDFIAEGMEEDEAVKEVEKLRDGGTINKLIRMLQEERKDKGLPDDNIAT
ncbi:hypothetical protein PG999_013152 [Apiospora kogelbergensis]|uniref:Transcription activator GCR1-like domain-containing protein n=1 Tax=Apiospora kogelbergensis TaxID=1337665 RepID=A0AAW0QQC8_9PEZI